MSFVPRTHPQQGYNEAVDDRRLLEGCLSPSVDVGRTTLGFPDGVMTYVDVGAGLIAATRIGTIWTPDGPDDDPPFSVAIWADYDRRAGQFTATSMQVERVADGPPVTSRGIPIAAMVRLVSQGAIFARAISPSEVRLGFALPDHKLPRTLDEAAWRDIAVVYRTADAFGHRAGQTLADHYSVSRSTAAKWIRELKDRNLLEPVMDGEVANRLLRAAKDDSRSVSLASLEGNGDE